MVIAPLTIGQHIRFRLFDEPESVQHTALVVNVTSPTQHGFSPEVEEYVEGTAELELVNGSAEGTRLLFLRGSDEEYYQNGKRVLFL